MTPELSRAAKPRSGDSLNELLGCTCTECLHQLAPKPYKLTRAIDGLLDTKWLDSAALEGIASIPWEEMHV
jgi:hypothetical protein